MAMTTRAAVWPGWARTVARPGPERWLWWVAAGAWVLLLAESARADLQAFGIGSGSHAHDGSAVAVGIDLLVMWAAMVMATMLPLIVPNVRFAARHTPRSRQGRVARQVVAGWSVAWAVGSVVLILALWALTEVLGAVWALVASFVVAFAWQLTRPRRLALARCHRMLVPPTGPDATRTTVGYGVALGRDCLITCAPLMAAMGAAGHDVVVMALLGWISWRDRLLPPHQPSLTTTGLVLLAAAGIGLLVV